MALVDRAWVPCCRYVRSLLVQAAAAIFDYATAFGVGWARGVEGIEASQSAEACLQVAARFQRWPAISYWKVAQMIRMGVSN